MSTRIKHSMASALILVLAVTPYGFGARRGDALALLGAAALEGGFWVRLLRGARAAPD